MKIIIVSLLLMVLVAGCFFLQKDTTDEIASDVVHDDDTPYISTFIFKVKKSEKQENPIITLENIIKAKGYLKKSEGFEEKHHEDGFQFEFMNDQNQVIEKAFAKNPLDKHFEVPEEDGHLEKINVKVKEDVLSVRISNSIPLLKVRIFSITEGKITFISELKLNK